MTARLAQLQTLKSKHSPIRTVALTAVILAAVAGGCIQGHDPRNDSSRVDTHERSAIVREA